MYNYISRFGFRGKAATLKTKGFGILLKILFRKTKLKIIKLMKSIYFCQCGGISDTSKPFLSLYNPLVDFFKFVTFMDFTTFYSTTTFYCRISFGILWSIPQCIMCTNLG